MNRSGPTDDAAADVRWCRGVSAALAGAAGRVGQLAEAIADDWRDAHGQEWAGRATLLHRELDRVAMEAAEIGTEIGAAIARRAEAAPTSVPPPSGPPTSWQEALAPLRAAVLGAVTRGYGPRLGSVDGDRTDHDLGMRIAELPEPELPEPG